MDSVRAAEVVWAAGFGEARPGDAVDPDTLFQAASLSKPVFRSAQHLAQPLQRRAGTDGQVLLRRLFVERLELLEQIAADLRHFAHRLRTFAEGFDDGLMPATYEGSLSPEDIDAILAYMKSV